mmetsp:Transcript_38285/g.87656  ORF Transcript_38285/g.87656 Transcript_38285/m.87656 type:complete len:237 (+) Transcript_38285:906-1616(+)
MSVPTKRAAWPCPPTPGPNSGAFSAWLCLPLLSRPCASSNVKRATIPRGAASAAMTFFPPSMQIGPGTLRVHVLACARETFFPASTDSTSRAISSSFEPTLDKPRAPKASSRRPSVHANPGIVSTIRSHRRWKVCSRLIRSVRVPLVLSIRSDAAACRSSSARLCESGRIGLITKHSFSIRSSSRSSNVEAAASCGKDSPFASRHARSAVMLFSFAPSGSAERARMAAATLRTSSE